MKALVSIRPEYVERILSGEKTYEYRRRIFKRPQVDTLVIYATMPVGKVVAEAGITGVLESSPEDIWEKTSRHAGISEDRFKACILVSHAPFQAELLRQQPDVGPPCQRVGSLSCPLP